LSQIRMLGDAVRLVETDAVAVTTENRAAQQPLLGGGAVWMVGGKRGRCSAGFNARTILGQGRMIYAGHCTVSGGPVTGADRTTVIGDITNANWKDGNDFAAVSVDETQWTMTGRVTKQNDATVPVMGSTEAQVGAALCKSGSKTGWTCGEIRAKDVTVNYGQPDGGTVQVSGLVQHSACVEPGDSGGSNLAGDQAQGITSGARLMDTDGDGKPDACLSNVNMGESVSWYQPINEVLSNYALTLVTARPGRSLTGIAGR
jgi:streptogrisin C